MSMHESRKACAALAVPDHALALLTVGLYVGLHAGELQKPNSTSIP